jgi:hypothetical protein
MRTLAVLSLIAALTVSGCSGDDAGEAVDQAQDAVSSAAADAEVQIPDVDWEKYGADLKAQIDELAEAADCESLEAQLDDQGQLDAEVVDYIKAKLEEAGC